MDWTNLICAGCGLLGTIIGSYSGIRLTSYRVEQLEKRLSQQDTLTARLARAGGADQGIVTARGAGRCVAAQLSCSAVPVVPFCLDSVFLASGLKKMVEIDLQE